MLEIFLKEENNIFLYNSTLCNIITYLFMFSFFFMEPKFVK